MLLQKQDLFIAVSEITCDVTWEILCLVFVRGWYSLFSTTATFIGVYSGIDTNTSVPCICKELVFVILYWIQLLRLYVYIQV